MRQAPEPYAAPSAEAPAEGPSFTSQDDAQLRDTLKRCSPSTRDAACAFRRTKSLDHLPAIVHGLIEHYVERDARAKLGRADDGLRLVEDLAIDSLTMLEIVFLAEDVLQISIDNEDLRPVRTVGDVKTFIASKLVASS
jgi:3-hydroxyacyl-[acyl-carrier-protein] dehydratase